MIIILILALSTILQFASATIALSLINLTGHKKAWIAISVAITLMAVRRTVTIFHLISEKAYENTVPLEFSEIAAEVIALCISILMLMGVIWITSLFREEIETGRFAREHEARFRSIFEVASTGIALCSPDGKFIEINPFLKNLLGYSQEEFSELTFDSLVATDRKEINYGRINFGESAQVSIDREIQLIDKSGNLKWTRSTTAWVVDSSQKPLFRLIIIQDIDTRKKAESELLYSQKRLEEAEHISNVGHWELNIESNKLFWSDEIYNIFEIDQNLFGASYEAFLAAIHPDDREKVDNGYSLSLLNKTDYEITHRLLMPNGKIKFVIEKCHTDFSKGGTPLRSMGTIQDVTKAVEAEKALRLSEELFSKAFRSSPHGLVISSLKEGRIIEVNDGFKRILGYTIGEEIGRTSKELKMWANPLERDKLIKKIQSEGFVKDYSIHMMTKAGRQLDCIVSIELITIEDEKCLLSVFRDVTEENRINEEVKTLRRQIELENEYLKEEVSIAHSFKDIIGQSKSLREVLQQVETVAKSDAAVLIHGDSGTGKELIARAIHDKSDRSAHPMVTLNCASIPHDLFESELFGHAKGAFTGAHADRIGRFELAEGGTLFLDEISEIPLDLQSTLLRVIQEKEFEKVGHEKTQHTNVRIISATNRDLKHEVEKGTFREDLYFRLNVFPIMLAPLRQRKEDIALLADHFLKISCDKLKIPEKTLKQKHIIELERYSWPGNIRELQNVIERAVITSREGPLVLNLSTINIELKDLKENLQETLKENPQEIFTFSELKNIERTNIVAALNEADWKISGRGGAAEILSVKPNTLTSRIKALEITRDFAS